MPADITMPQLSDTMTEGTVVKWHKKVGDKVKSGEKIADVETDKAVMEMESFDSGTIAAILVQEGGKVPVGATLAVIATGSEKVEDVKQGAGSAAGGPPPSAGGANKTPEKAPEAKASAPAAKAATSAPAAQVAPAPSKKGNFNFDIIVIGGGPAGYAAAIRAGQLKKRVLCVEKENLGGTCLNWGCIPTKALLEDGAFVRKLRTEAEHRGITFDNLKVDFAKPIARSRAIADKLSKGIAHLFRKYEVKHEVGMGKITAANTVEISGKDGKKTVTAADIVIATGARSRPLPGAEFDGKVVINSRDAMILPKQPKKMAIIGAGAIGCEFADFYNAMGTEVTIIEMLPNLLPIEDKDCSLIVEKIFAKRGIKIYTDCKTDKVEKTNDGVKLTISGKQSATIDADVVLIAIGVMGNVEGIANEKLGLELFKGHVKTEPNEYKTSVPGVWAVGDVIGPPWLAHVAHHEAVACIEKICGQHPHPIDYNQIPGCTYTHPQVASMGLTEQKARDAGYEIKIGKFPFTASGRALAAGETDGFVKLIFEKKYGELLGVHMVGEQVTELLSELVLARKLEATEQEILEAMHPHPTISEAVMEAAAAADGRAIHI
jgi:dihydrolipoamide dehydrogenase